MRKLSPRSTRARIVANSWTFLAAGAAAAGALSYSDTAAAYCRAVSKAPPAGWNIASQGCFTGSSDGAKDLYWGNTCIGYSVHRGASRQVTFEAASALVASAFDAWNEASCPEGGRASIQAVDLGPVDCGEVRYNEKNANQNVIVFRDDVWPSSDPNNTLGLTTITFDTATGEILGADMEINATQKLRVPTRALERGGSGLGPDQAEQDGYDLGTILSHEVGHFLGLAHTAVGSAVMFARYQEGLPLADDDKAGLCATYASDGRRATSAGSVTAGACDPTPPQGFSRECAAPPVEKPPAPSSKSSCALSASGVTSVDAGFLVLIAGTLGFAWRRRARRGKTLARVAGFTSMLAVTLGALGSHASVAIAIAFDELVGRAELAAIVTPSQRRSIWENGRIVTYTEVHVDRLVAGSGVERAWVRTLGGEVGRIGQRVDGEAVLPLDEPALVFLERAKVEGCADAFEVSARAQGAFALAARPGEPARLIPRAEAGALAAPAKSRAVLRAAARVLHGRTLEEAERAIIAAWPALHANAPR
jgi:hypothetical protein